MTRPDPIAYAERLYGAIQAARFSPIAFLAFGNAVKNGTPLRGLPRIAAEPFMRIVGEMLDLEEEASGAEILDVQLAEPAPPAQPEQTHAAVPAAATTVPVDLSPDAAKVTDLSLVDTDRL